MDVECVGQCIEYLQVEQLAAFSERRLERPRTAFPVEEGAGFLDGRCNREDNVGCVSHIGTPQLKAHHEAGGADGGTRRGRVGEVVGVDASDDERTQRTTRRGVENASSVAAGLGRNGRRPVRSHLTTRVAIGYGATAWQ